MARQLAEAMDNVNFSPTLMANLIVNYESLYTQNQLMEMMKQIIKQQAVRFDSEWAGGRTNEALLLSSHLAEVIDAHDNPNEHIEWTLF